LSKPDGSSPASYRLRWAWGGWKLGSERRASAPVQESACDVRLAQVLPCWTRTSADSSNRQADLSNRNAGRPLSSQAAAPRPGRREHRGPFPPTNRGNPPVEFQLQSPFEPAGDQPQAIEKLVRGLRQGRRHQVLMGVTGSGKTFTMANVIQAVQRPVLVLSHNKTLAAQLYATTTTTSRKPTSRSATFTSKRTLRSTRKSTASAWRPPAR